MPIITKQVREGPFYEGQTRRPYEYRILAVGERTEDGRLNCPLLKFFQEEKREHPEDLERLTALVEHTARRGPPRNTKKFKPVEGSDGLFELKNYQHRILCFFDREREIICTNGVVKKGDRLPPPDVKIAASWKRAYFNAKMRKELMHEAEHE